MAARSLLQKLQSLSFHRLILVLCVLFIAAHTWNAFTREITQDEVQMMSAAWHVTQGEQLYTQIWDNHGPLITWLLAGLIKLVTPESHAVFYLARFLMFLCLAATAWLVWVWARRQPTQFDSRLFAPLVLLFFLAMPVLAERGQEIRADVPFHLVWVAALVLWMRAWARRSLLWFLIAGLVLGIGFSLSLKTLMLGVAAGLMFITVMIRERRLMWIEMIVFGLGTAVVPLLLVLVMGPAGNLNEFWDAYVGQNIDRARPDLDDGIDELEDLDRLWTYLFLASFIYVGYRMFRRQAATWLACLWAGGLFLVIQYLFLLPTHHYQSFLPPLFPIAVVMAWTLLDLARRSRADLQRPLGAAKPNRIAAALIAALFVWLLVAHHKPIPEMPAQIADYNRILEVIPEDAGVADAEGHPVMRRHPLYYKAFVTTLRNRYEDGLLDFNFVDEVDSQDIPYLLYSKRMADLGDEVCAFISHNYIPLQADKTMAAGKILTHDTPTTAPLTIRIAGEYHWRLGERTQGLQLDGTPAPNPLTLADGQYQLTWPGDEPLVLSIAPPEHWGNWPALLEAPLADEDDYKKDAKRLW